MGDMADWIIDQIIDGMCDDEDGWEQPRDPYYIRCKYCYKTGYKWDNSSGAWRLVTRSGKIHRCRMYP